MNQKQINRKEMYDATLHYLDLNSQKWSPIQKIGEFKNELVEINKSIEIEAKKQADAQIFVGKSKTQLKHIIANKADVLNDTIEVYAMLTGNNALAQQMADSASSLNKMKKENFIMRVKLIVEKATEFLKQLTKEYGVTKEQVTDLQSDIDTFLEMNGMPRAYRIESSVATQDLTTLFTQATNVLENKLDKVMKIFKNKDANFYNGYVSARMVIDN